MRRNKDVKKNLLGHSEVKVKLLGYYLDRYLNIIANDGYTSQIHIHDMFCGEGLYDDGGAGSPLVILKAIKDLNEVTRLNRHTLPVSCYFNDKEQWKINKLTTVVETKNLHNDKYGEISYSQEDYQELIKDLLKKTQSFRNEKAFFFIDPYGYKHIKARDIKSLLHNRKAEVLLFLPTQFMYRFKENGTPEALKDFIEELIDIESFTSKDVWDFISLLKNSFREYLGKTYFVDTFTIQKDAQTVFCLFFFSSHIRGFEKMLEAKWEIDKEQGKGWEYNDFGNSLFASQSANPLKDKLIEYLRTGKKSNGELYEFVLHSGFLPKHANEILRSLQDSNMLTTKLSDDKSVRKGVFYINYENYKNNPDKLYVILK